MVCVYGFLYVQLNYIIYQSPNAEFSLDNSHTFC